MVLCRAIEIESLAAPEPSPVRTTPPVPKAESSAPAGVSATTTALPASPRCTPANTTSPLARVTTRLDGVRFVNPLTVSVATPPLPQLASRDPACPGGGVLAEAGSGATTPPITTDVATSPVVANSEPTSARARSTALR